MIIQNHSPLFPEGFFDRVDQTPDKHFYLNPRLVTHLDVPTIEALTNAYRDYLRSGSHLLDLMSSWISHLPPEMSFERVAGLGMNEKELQTNARLDSYVIHDLNENPTLPFGEAEFDIILNCVSVQYLTHPIEVFADAARVLRPGGLHIIATSHRMFPTKAIRAWQILPSEKRLALISQYFELTGNYEPATIEDRSPQGSDPLWLVTAKRTPC